MTIRDIQNLRLRNLLLSNPRFNTPGETVHWLGAVQAQDHAGALFSIALRMQGGTQKSIEKAIAEKSIVRTWPMRGTLHFVAAEDAHWMLRLLTPRIISRSAGRYKQLELDDHVFAKSRDLIVSELLGGRQMTRAEVYALLENGGVSTGGQRGMHIINHLAQTRILCHGTHNEKQPTYTLLDEWVSSPRQLDETESIAEITLRYFTSHGPATLNDFVWWTGLKVSDAKLGLQLNAGKLHSMEVNGASYWYSQEQIEMGTAKATFLLPGFDEYMLGYTDRSIILEPAHWAKIIPGNNGMFMPTIVIDGKVEGTWKRTLKKDSVQLDMYPFKKIPLTKKRMLEGCAKEYGKYLAKNLSATNWLNF
ncbi:winged helix DNA-binding domain-containing protein [Dyadobacter sp.]|uniref:winged helix DNA-binding domain-containing protein n=1 Tax=Dyadobacter sp. TaxID=1914288 RepID=UPI003F6E4658